MRLGMTAGLIIEGYRLHKFHRDFAAITMAFRPANQKIEDSYEEYKKSVFLHAWIGNLDAVREARRDYLLNSEAKGYIPWRCMVANSTVLKMYAEKPQNVELRPQDSLWVGSVFRASNAFGSLISTCSGLMPDEDEFIARINAGGEIDFNELEKNRGVYKSTYPAENIDTFDGRNFNRPPDLSWLPAA